MTYEDIKNAVNQYSEKGYRISKIAEIMNISETTVSEIYYQKIKNKEEKIMNNIEVKKAKDYTTAEKIEVVELILNGTVKFNEIAKERHLFTKTISDWRKAYQSGELVDNEKKEEEISEQIVEKAEKIEQIEIIALDNSEKITEKAKNEQLEETEEKPKKRVRIRKKDVYEKQSLDTKLNNDRNGFDKELEEAAERVLKAKNTVSYDENEKEDDKDYETPEKADSRNRKDVDVLLTELKNYIDIQHEYITESIYYISENLSYVKQRIKKLFY
jgi:transposase-like protein